MFYSPKAIPCYEQPERCFVASPDGYYISCNKKGRVSLLDNQKKVPGQEELWLPLRVSSGRSNSNGVAEPSAVCGHRQSSVVFKSFSYEKYLCVVQNSINANGTSTMTTSIQTCDAMQEAVAWAIRPTGSYHTEQDLEVMLQCQMGQLVLDYSQGDSSSSKSQSVSGCVGAALGAKAVSSMPKLTCRHGTTGDSMGFGWKLELQTGELCYIYSPKYSDKKILCRPRGGIELSDAWGGWEVWRFVEAGGTKGEVYLTSWTHNTKILKANADGSVETTENRDDPGTRWVVYRNTFQRAADVVKENVAAQEKDDGFVSIDKDESSNADDVMGASASTLQSTSTTKQREEGAVDGMTIFLSDGSSIFRKTNPGDANESKFVNPAHDGVIIELSGTDRVLSTDGETLRTINLTSDELLLSQSNGGGIEEDGEETKNSEGGDMTGLDYVWHLDAAHRQRFFLNTCARKLNQVKRVGNSSPQSPKLGFIPLPGSQSNPTITTLTSDRELAQQWEPIVDDDDIIILRNCETGRYLGSLSGGEVLAVSSPGEGEKWIKVATKSLDAHPSMEGSVELISFKFGRKLTWDSRNGTLSTTVVYPDEEIDGAEQTTCWHISPVMPCSMSAEQRRNLIIAGSVAAVAVVVAPFAVTGVVAALGFGTEGIVASSAAARMMSTAAVAGGGAIEAGGTIATLQSIGAAGLGAMGTSAALGGGAVVGGTIFGTTAAVTHRQQVHSAEDGTCAVDEKGTINSGEATMNRPFASWKEW
jgi:hypothetical protein